MARYRKVGKPEAKKDHAGSVDHATLVTWVNEADDATGEARGISEKCRDYYDSKQLTDAEVRALKKRKQPVVVINRCKPKMDALMGMEKSAKTTVKAFPRTPKHAAEANSASEAIRFVLQDNAFDQIRSQVWEFILIEGLGGCEVLVKEAKDGLRVTLKPLFWDRIIYDPHSRSKHFTDNPRYLGQVVWMDWDDAVGSYPDAKDVLDQTITGSTTYEDKPKWVDTIRHRVKLVELYYRCEGEWYHCILTYGGFVESPKVSPFKNEEGETEHAYELASAFVDREGQRYGAMKQLLDVQDEINKRRSKFLHLASVRQVRWERGAVDDINKARDELAKPDGVIETTPGMEFEVLKTGDMAASQFNLLTEAKMEIDAVGVNAALTGKDQKAVSGVALRERQMAGQTELGPMFDVLRHWQLRVYRKIWNRIRQYWTQEKWIRVTDDETNIKWVGINAPITAGERVLDQAKAQLGEGPEYDALQQKVSQDPSMQEVVGRRNNVAELDVDIIIDEVPDTLTQQTEDFQALSEMVKSGFPLPPAAVIEASPLANKEKILKAMGQQAQIPPQVKAQMEQLSAQLQELSQENQQLKSGQAEKMAKLSTDREEAQAQFNLDAWKAEQQFQLQKQKQDRDAQLAREKAEAELTLQEEKAQREFSLSAQKCEHEQAVSHTQMARQGEEHEMKKQMMARDKLAEAETEVLPQILQKVEVSFGPMVEALVRLEKLFAKVVEGQQAVLSEMQRPKQVSLGALQHDSSGRITGGVVRTMQ